MYTKKVIELILQDKESKRKTIFNSEFDADEMSEKPLFNQAVDHLETIGLEDDYDIVSLRVLDTYRDTLTDTTLSTIQAEEAMKELTINQSIVVFIGERDDKIDVLPITNEASSSTPVDLALIASGLTLSAADFLGRRKAYVDRAKEDMGEIASPTELAEATVLVAHKLINWVADNNDYVITSSGQVYGVDSDVKEDVEVNSIMQ